MVWFETLSIDRRSKQHPIDQLEAKLLELIQLEIIPVGVALPSFNVLSQTTAIPEAFIRKLFDKLTSLGLLTFKNQHYFVHEYNYVRFRFPLPFAHRKPDVHEHVLHETIETKGYVNLPREFIPYFDIPPIYVFHMRKHYTHLDLIKAISDTYYVLDPSTYPIEPDLSTLLKEKDPSHRYIRLIDVIPPSKTLNNQFQSSDHPLFLRGFYRFEKAPYQPYEIGIVTTVRQFSYRIQLNTSINDIF